MGLIDEAIAEFQLAAKDEQRLLECSSMLGICFLDKGMPKLAVKWFEKGLQAPGRPEEEYQGLRYDLASATRQRGTSAPRSALHRAVRPGRQLPGRGDQGARAAGRSGLSRDAWRVVLSVLSSLLVGAHPGGRALDRALGRQLPAAALPRGCAPFLLSAFTRGAVSGLGVVNILLALHEARHHRVTGSGEFPQP